MGGDAEAVYHLGQYYRKGMCGVTKDIPRAIELFTEAARLGSMNAHCRLGLLYNIGDAVERDLRTAVKHHEIAAKGGHPIARFVLAKIELDAGNYDRALKHLKISAKMGHEDSLNEIKMIFTHGR